MPRVLIVDDSTFVRYMLQDRFRERGWEPFVASSGEEAVKMLARLSLDLITIDAEMPGLSGIAAISSIRREWGGPIVMISSQTTHGAEKTWESLDAGATDFVGKLEAGGVVSQIVEKYEACIRINRSRQAPVSSSRRMELSWRVVVIGAATGGPKTLARILGQIDVPLQTPLIIIQHMPESFTASLAARLGQVMKSPVAPSPLAPEKMAWGENMVVLARGGYQLRMDPAGVWSEPGIRVHGAMPAIDVGAADGVKSFGSRFAMAILTGMGEDGADAAVLCHNAGGMVMVQDPSTAVVWGMPQAVLSRQAATRVGNPDDLGRWINQLAHGDLGALRSGRNGNNGRD